MTEKEEKAVKKVTTIIATLVVLSLGVLGYIASERSSTVQDDEDNQGTKTVYIATTTTEFVSTTTTTIRNIPTKEVRDVRNVYNEQTGPTFRSPTLGLTVPGAYQVIASQNVYAGVPTTISYKFYTSGVLAFTINAFSKEQWNDIRIQETRLAAAGDFNRYLGEGRYMGENKLFIYSYIPALSTPPMSTRFY
ncbi:MAG: hypothetical protein ACYCY6_02310 [Minisyncoccota bacterium]